VQVQLHSERNIYETATGRVLLAYLSEKDLDRFIQHSGLPDATLWPEVDTKERLLDALKKVKTEELARTNFQNRHVRGFAVPISVNEQVIASLSIFLPEYRCSEAHEKAIVAGLKASAAAISQKLSV
jgi:IclR family transcriptional regulator, KDG regulon repressor